MQTLQLMEHFTTSGNIRSQHNDKNGIGYPEAVSAGCEE